MSVNILFFGDIVGSLGRKGVEDFLKAKKEARAVDFVIANGENATHGHGRSFAHYNELTASGVDVLTSGNHFFNCKDVFSYSQKRVKAVRPRNLDKDAPGVGSRLFSVKGRKIRVSNFLGRSFIYRGQGNPFYAFDRRYRSEDEGEVNIVDFHGEATAEKRAFAEYVDSRALAVIGTHTHVQTNDPKLLSKGTFFLTDVGRNGPYDSIIGDKKEGIIHKTMTGMPSPREVCEKGRIQINAVLLTVNENTHCVESYKLINETRRGR